MILGTIIGIAMGLSRAVASEVQGGATTTEPQESWPTVTDEAWLNEPHPSCPESLFYHDEVTPG